MLTLRIWLPSPFDTRKLGFASIEVDGGAGGAYMSVRPIKQDQGPHMPPRTAKLSDDTEAEGADNVPRAWRFGRNCCRKWSNRYCRSQSLCLPHLRNSRKS